MLDRYIFFLKRQLWQVLNKRAFGFLGSKSYIQKPYILINNKKHIYIGRRVLIRKDSRIEPICNWIGEIYNPSIYIGDNVKIEQGLHLTCANKVKIGTSSLISSYVMITDLDHDYSDITKPILSQPLIIQETEIGDYCFIGTGAKIFAGVHIGEHSIIGANAVVTRDIPAYSVAVGIPAKVIKKYDFEEHKWVNI